MEKSNYKVSIVTVVYNGVKTIEQTIQSVLRQTYRNIEYIIIDGLSTDGTQQIVEKYMDFIVCFVSEKDKGLYDAMNRGIQHASGEIIGIINSDDWYVGDTVEKVVSFFEQNDVDLVYGKIMSVYPDGKEKISKKKPLEKLWYEMVVPHPSVFVKKEVYEKYGGFNLEYKIASDYELMLRFYSRHVKFGFIDDIMAYFRVGGLSSKMRATTIKEHRKITMHYIRFCLNKSEVLAKIEEWQEGAMLSLAIRERKMLPKALSIFFEDKVSEIIIWGTGSWGERCYEGLNCGETKVMLFVDNDSAKWNQEFHGIRIAEPGELLDREGYILIAVRYNVEEIQQQIDNLENKKIKCVGLKELKDIFEHLMENESCAYGSKDAEEDLVEV